MDMTFLAIVAANIAAFFCSSALGYYRGISKGSSEYVEKLIHADSILDEAERNARETEVILQKSLKLLDEIEI